MKSQIIEKKDIKSNKDFPKMMKTDKGTVVLFTSNGHGTVVSSNGCHIVGDYAENWLMGCFEYFDGQVILENN